MGNVTDPSGAVVPNAAVRAQNLDTGAVLQTTTGNTGSFAIGNVPPGRFEVTITKEGFGTFKAPSVSVEMNTQARVDVALQVGNTNATITVSTQDAQLQIDSADVHDAISSKQFQDLPQPTRTYQGLVGLVTGVAPPSPDFAGGGGTNNPGRSFAIEANGTSQTGTDVRIDGVSAVNPWVQFYSTAVPSTVAIQLVSVVTSSPDAEQGLASGRPDQRSAQERDESISRIAVRSASGQCTQGKTLLSAQQPVSTEADR
ncbi:MAG: TonB-dependent receptor family protein [Edaphobacter sp.]|nr:TonB-dependent receptor family protein [Edaphobacter sp.]